MLEQCARASIPGDPEAIHEAARGLERDAERAGEEILVDIRLARDTALAGWSAPSADEFGAFVSRALSFETDQIEAQRAGAQVWNTYAEELKAAQRALEQAIENERSAERASDRAEEDSPAEGKAEDAARDAREDQVNAARDAAEAAERASQAMERVIDGLAAVPAASRPPLSGILNDYQVAEDEMVDWPAFPLSLLTDPERMTRTEADLLGTLGALELRDLQGIRNDASAEGQRRYPEPNVERRQDGHQDAFRHAYASALMVRQFGPGFARRFTTAHEGQSDPANPAQREAMDLYNNEVGRRIASEYPEAEPGELADRVSEALERGDTVVVDRGEELAWSDRVPEHGHGNVEGKPPRPGGRPAAGADSGDYAGTGS